ncbi:MAG: substrate-binding domain-containing protein [Proteobacteria bacterium]|nr:substrate-binding domain-containing protein [Pseudomonadota bacterium]
MAITKKRRPRRRYKRGIDSAIALLKTMGTVSGTCCAAEIAANLDIPHASMHRIARTFAASDILDTSQRGRIGLGPLCDALAQRFEAGARREDEQQLARHSSSSVIGQDGFGLLRHDQACMLTDAGRFRRTPKFRIGFLNAALDSPWRTALVHAVEFGSAKRCELVSSLAVRHAAHDVNRQIADIESLVDGGVDGLVVSALGGERVGPVIARAAERGVPTVLVDRGLPEAIPHTSFVTCDDWMIGRTMARWLAEYLSGEGGVLLLPGDEKAEPAQRRLSGARSVFAEFSGIEILDVQWTAWQRDAGRAAMIEALRRHGDAIRGVWCDSGLQAAGSLMACIDAGGPLCRIPPHTGGDLNLTYKLAVRHRVPLAAVDYPPVMGLRAIEVLLDVLRGRWVPRRVDVATEVVITRGHATASVRPDLWADEHVRWDLPDELILATGIGQFYNPRAFRVHYRGNRYNRSAALMQELRDGV